MSSEFNSSRKGARFERGTTTFIKTFIVDSRGGVFEINEIDKALKSIFIKIPPNAVTTETKISIGINNGTFLPIQGEASGQIIVINAENVQSFQQAFEFIVFESQSKKTMPIGYSIEENGQIKSIDSVFDKKNGSISFYSFRPLMFTWIYAKTR